MIKRISLALVLLAACGSAQDGSNTTPAQDQANAPALSGAENGSETVASKDWVLRDLSGAEVSLANYSGKTVVLEWFNPNCPFIKYAHGQGPLKDMASRVSGDGSVTWLTINSSASGPNAQVAVNQKAADNWSIKNPLLMDTSGKVGRFYGAKTTPHMFVLDGNGEVVYKGALDNAPLGEAQGEYVNYVDTALAELAAGKPITTAETKSYGCSVKY